MPSERPVDANHLRAFSDWFDVLAVTHRLQAPEDMRSKMKSEYFDVLRPYPIEAVSSAYESLRRKMKKWPVPADWLEALPPAGNTGRLMLATAAEVTENDEAERLGYEAVGRCACPRCVEAGCFLPPRYVPRLDRDGLTFERRHPLRDGRPILLGRWLHGEDLKRWYAARAQFYELKTKLGVELPLSALPEDRIQRLATEARAVMAEVR